MSKQRWRVLTVRERSLCVYSLSNVSVRYDISTYNQTNSVVDRNAKRILWQKFISIISQYFEFFLVNLISFIIRNLINS